MFSEVIDVGVDRVDGENRIWAFNYATSSSQPPKPKSRDFSKQSSSVLCARLIIGVCGWPSPETPGPSDASDQSATACCPSS